ncbi:inositol monophosphatase family protein [Pararhizobium sp.]|uniref:inositol monophosphatase family protein n=1 Tax=Pararhizobium sp. TaxID=1977563 RepID=UPI00271A2321|nr:inositol monophosphatase family protein [Pararhizobium sp.]MDO9415154.1 inositol monophosphatase family protein [Pararhizobium sp.]
MARSALLNVMVQATFKAGKSLSRDFGEVQNLQVSLKGPADYVAQAGRKAEKVIREELMKARPTYGYLGEEGGEIKGNDGAHRWIVDPLDGTTNFLHGIPFFAISVALERNGEIVGGVIFNPATDELYTAERGGGAFLNDRRLRVAARKSLSDAVIATATPYLGHGSHGAYLIELRHVMGEVAGIRSNGAASLDLAYVAAGRFDGFWERGVDAWDIAAGMLLVREAGGWISDVDGGSNSLEDGTIVAGNEHIRKALQDVLHRPIPGK